MKAFRTVQPGSVPDAVSALRAARTSGQSAVVAGGGSDLLGMMKDRLIAPDLVVRLAAMKDMDQVRLEGDSLSIGGQTTLDAISRHDAVRRLLPVLAEAADTVATPQIRNVGTLAGNLCQRPWCWYYRNGFRCFKNGGNTCYSVSGQNQFHAIFGGGPSFIVHPSDTAPALVALDATFRLIGPAGERRVAASDFFALPSVNPARENVLAEDEVLAGVEVPVPAAGTRSHYLKIMDREAWTHAVVSAAVVLQMDGNVCRRARLVLGGVAPIPWRLPDIEPLLAGRPLTSDVIDRAAALAVAGARPLAHNAYKIPLTQAAVSRALTAVAG
jgi:xanthine dehydrogenase YagS FAD-binding subunit